MFRDDLVAPIQAEMLRRHCSLVDLRSDFDNVADFFSGAGVPPAGAWKAKPIGR
jgi:hypothetical protein